MLDQPPDETGGARRLGVILKVDDHATTVSDLSLIIVRATKKGHTHIRATLYVVYEVFKVCRSLSQGCQLSRAIRIWSERRTSEEKEKSPEQSLRCAWCATRSLPLHTAAGE